MIDDTDLGSNTTHHPSKGKKFAVEILTSSEVKQLLNKCNPRCATGCRNRAMLAILYRGMLRVSEALSLLPRDVDLQSGTINDRRGKGSKQRIVGVDAGCCALLELWMAKRARYGFNPQTPIFSTLQGRPLSRKYVWTLIKRLAKKAGIQKRVHPHGMRHTGAVELVQEGHDLLTIGAQLGHSNLSTTSRYINHLCPKQLVATMHARSWEV